MHFSPSTPPRDHLRREYQRADDIVNDVLTGDVTRFFSSAHMRDTLNHARATREWAITQLALLEDEAGEGLH